jgi:hypothetical protein
MLTFLLTASSAGRAGTTASETGLLTPSRTLVLSTSRQVCGTRLLKGNNKVCDTVLCCAYYGITGNSVSLIKFRRGSRGRWMKWLRRCLRAAYAKNWIWWSRFHERYPLPPDRAIHSIFSRT